MKEGDFRIGIHVKYEGSEITLDEDYLEVLLAVRNYEDYEPIPLTEEWLVKLGFNDQRNSKLGFSIIGLGHLYANENYFDLWSWYQNDMDSFPIKYDIKYVHQLQNLHFALTGEELTIKS